MRNVITRVMLLCCFLYALAPAVSKAQSANASLSGTVMDSSGATVPDAKLTLTSGDTGAAANFTTGADGLYTFSNLTVGTYELRVVAGGFRTYVQTGIKLHLGDSLRQDVSLQVGTEIQTLEVSANPSSLNYETAELKTGVNPDTIRELPLLVAGAIRSSTNFVNILPGVARGSGDTTSDRINGSQQYMGAMVLDGASLVNPSGMNGLYDTFDFPQSPDIISEMKVLISNYSPQYGETAGATFVMSIRSGTEQFHGSAYEFNRNTNLNARQFGVPQRPEDIENDFGFNVGGPVKLPVAWSGRNRSFFFVNYEDFRIAGALARQTISLPSMQERQGDFSDWVDTSGNIIPIYDPATTQPNPNFNQSQPVGPNNLPYLRQQFMGCNGNTPNVICASDPRLQNSLAPGWLKFLPTPTSPGPLNNYLAPPVPSGGTPYLISPAYTVTFKIDEYLGSKDHVSVSMYYKNVAPTTFTHLPPQISYDGVSYKRTHVERLNYDRTISPTLLNHVVFGYNNDKYWGGGIDGPYASQLPQIPGVDSHSYPPQLLFTSGFSGLGSGQGFAQEQPWMAPAYVVNDMLTWVKDTHTFKFGGEYRNIGNSFHLKTGESGIFNFASTETGLNGTAVSGSPIASFLLGEVDSGSAVFKAVDDVYSRQQAGSVFFGDTWKAAKKLSVDYGLRWDLVLPPVEKWNHESFLDPNLANPGADGLPGALAFAGYGPGRCNCRHPENDWYKAFAPRLSLAYAARTGTVIRAGYGIFYDWALPPGSIGGVAQDGFNTTPSFGSSLAGMNAAFLLGQGLPQNFIRPPVIDPSFDNGQPGPMYRPIDGDRMPYSQQWDLTVDHQFTNDFYVSVAYVGNKATHLSSNLAEINALDPKYLSMGAQLYDIFQPGQTTLDGVKLPFASFATTMQACAPSVAQALLPFPQYCSGFYGYDEHAGNSTYHSLQVKAEHRFARGLWFLTSYTLSKSLTDSDENLGLSPSGVFSPYQRGRYKSLAMGDIPQELNIAFVYNLPFGNGQHWLSGKGWVSKIVGDWVLSNVFAAESGLPFYIRSSTCNIPGQFQMSCLPALLPGQSPFAQPQGHFDVNHPLLNVNAFEPLTSFNFYQGQGPRIANFRQPGYTNQDVALERRIALRERLAVNLRADFFNAWNWHNFSCVGTDTCSSLAFTNDLASPAFGMWNGGVTNPRNIQVSARISF